MSLSDRLKKKAVKVETVVVDGDKYVVTGKSKRDRSALMARCRNKRDGSLNGDKLEGLMLEACVADEEGSTATAADWDATPSHITGPLVKAIMSVCGLDDEDLGSDPKDCDSIES
jgi:hypothetical protein